MNNMLSIQLLYQLWLDRKNEINNIVRKNIYVYFVINSILGVFSLGIISIQLGRSFPTTAFLLILGAYFFLAVVVFRVDYDRKNNSRKKRYLILMTWQNLFFLVLSISFISFSIIGWLNSELIQVTIFEVLLLLLLIILMIVWWFPRNIKTKLISYGADRSRSWRRSNSGYIWIIGLIIYLINLYDRVATHDQKNVGHLVFGLLMAITGIWVFARGIYQFYCDYLFFKNGFLDEQRR